MEENNNLNNEVNMNGMNTVPETSPSMSNFNYEQMASVSTTVPETNSSMPNYYNEPSTTPVSSDTQTEQNNTIVINNTPEKKSNNKRAIILFVILGLLILGTGVFYGYKYFSEKIKEDNVKEERESFVNTAISVCKDANSLNSNSHDKLFCNSKDPICKDAKHVNKSFMDNTEYLLEYDNGGILVHYMIFNDEYFFDYGGDVSCDIQDTPVYVKGTKVNLYLLNNNSIDEEIIDPDGENVNQDIENVENIENVEG